MSGDRYTIKNNKPSHFITYTVVGWIDSFNREDYESWEQYEGGTIE